MQKRRIIASVGADELKYFATLYYFLDWTNSSDLEIWPVTFKSKLYKPASHNKYIYYNLQEGDITSPKS